MSDTPSASESPTAQPSAGKPAETHGKKDEGFFSFLFWLVLGVVVLRSFIISPFNIPSESMLPRLLDGDYLFATKWSYGYSKYSLPFSAPLIPGRVLASQPERGDVVIFKAPPGNDVDYIKRVIGLPGDEVQMKDGQVWLNGKPVPKEPVADFVVPVTPNTHCYTPEFERTAQDGTASCHYPQFRETLPNGKSYNVLDLGRTPQDDTGVFIVPEDHMFLMGDNRDNSLDSRFPAIEGEGIGMVPQGNLVGKAALMMFSTDGSAEWLKPWTWFTAARWSRIGGTF
ncbi:signal peptidase I [Novosphingobium album (ex Hu et al. 2023)]|uniref:Signal peptidase I n=1 Tax=Novosphingobium album (ex Hu et al. 2023) TaxID=2930093 RepID=A0ABT0B3Q9_9SPHN|nr:signal peptidase I [Novosphingobium album (ex Hu et al. 2023)]MCJ2179608.1 signal peptidase I [Novosphingobium album (ex Hu et al. 2023)]